jgi:hypothetical protein
MVRTNSVRTPHRSMALNQKDLELGKNAPFQKSATIAEQPFHRNGNSCQCECIDVRMERVQCAHHPPAAGAPP